MLLEIRKTLALIARFLTCTDTKLTLCYTVISITRNHPHSAARCNFDITDVLISSVHLVLNLRSQLNREGGANAVMYLSVSIGPT